MAEISPRPLVVLYRTVKGLQVVMFPLQVERVSTAGRVLMPKLLIAHGDTI